MKQDNPPAEEPAPVNTNAETINQDLSGSGPSEEDSRSTQQQALIAEGSQQRPRPDGEEQRKPKWQRFLESAGGAALITVFVGGVLGQWITSTVQEGLKEREFRQAWMKTRGDQALLAYKEYSDQKQDLVRRVYELVGNCIAASDDLITLTGPEFKVDQLQGASRENTQKQIMLLQENYNKVSGQWRSDQEKLKLLIAYYYPDRPEVSGAWEETQASLTGFMKCARNWHIEKSTLATTENVTEACKEEKSNLASKLSKLTRIIQESHHYPWEGWDTPEKLRHVLEGSQYK